jgi:hypothetical protein
MIPETVAVVPAITELPFGATQSDAAEKVAEVDVEAENAA